jgi:hypothetical protein
VAPHDIFGPGSTYNTVKVFTSPDKGATWRETARIKGQFWSNLFVHKGALYLMGTSKKYGYLVIRRSTDNGRTWTVPSDDTSGLLLADAKYIPGPMPVVCHNGRIWRAALDRMGGRRWGEWGRAFMMSAPLESDLLRADSWQCSNRLGYDRRYLEGRFGGWLEGNAVVTPEGRIVDILRVHENKVGGKAAIIRISEDGTKATFDPDRDFIDFPGGCKKFTIRYDPVSSLYWSLANIILDADRDKGAKPERIRNTQGLLSSPDLRTWKIRRTVLHHPDVKRHGFQYLDWQFEGDDIIAVSRTAWDERDGSRAHSQHDANYMTFHRFEDFRKAVEPADADRQISKEQKE